MKKKSCLVIAVIALLFLVIQLIPAVYVKSFWKAMYVDTWYFSGLAGHEEIIHKGVNFFNCFLPVCVFTIALIVIGIVAAFMIFVGKTKRIFHICIWGIPACDKFV